MRKRMKALHKADILRKTGRLMEQGYPLQEAAQLLKHEHSGPTATALNKWIEQLKNGTSLYESLCAFQLPGEIQAYIYFAEQEGNIAEGLAGAGEMYQKREQFRQNISRLLRYPLLLLWLFLLLFSFMVFYVLPQFQLLFQSLDTDFPLITRVVLSIADSIPFLVGVAAMILLVLAFFYIRVFRHLTPRRQVQGLQKVPGLSYMVQLVITYYFSYHFGRLLRSGLSINDVIQVFTKQADLLFFQTEAERISAQLIAGESFSDTMNSGKIYRPELPAIIRHGQQSGSLSKDLIYYSEHLWDRIHERMQALLMIIQPLLFCLVGGLILLLFLSVFLPVFQLISALE
ncbi:competence type IV pilus assembly protein ComGB [Salsuginibacillus kocurii]|uniref:competence type IV pilus assembly protein ComGB n=1 Tax=Salsuginibacillus kocurii TaxID=427078 RepID=UPI000366DF79|nr:competence type IV pilus assembly protein ComGB [Salsuginibacillus kocurii]